VERSDGKSTPAAQPLARATHKAATTCRQERKWVLHGVEVAGPRRAEKPAIERSATGGGMPSTWMIAGHDAIGVAATCSRRPPPGFSRPSCCSAPINVPCRQTRGAEGSAASLPRRTATCRRSGPDEPIAWHGGEGEMLTGTVNASVARHGALWSDAAGCALPFSPSPSATPSARWALLGFAHAADGKAHFQLFALQRLDADDATRNVAAGSIAHALSANANRVPDRRAARVRNRGRVRPGMQYCDGALRRQRASGPDRVVFVPR
jgi:hypothetical protein